MENEIEQNRIKTKQNMNRKNVYEDKETQKNENQRAKTSVIMN